MDWFLQWLPWIIVALIVLILVIYVVRAYNKLVSLSVRVDNGWSQIDVQLKKRFDLIPNLVETVKGYAAHESATFENVTKWRTAAMQANTPEEKIKSNQELSRALANLLFSVEQYPDLKANQNFLDLQAQLQDIESKIAFARQFYNDTVMRYNEYVIHFPSNLIASMFHFMQRSYYEVDEAEKAAPQVKF